MTASELAQPILTKKDILDVLVDFNDKTLQPQIKETMEEVMPDGLANFNVGFLEPAIERLDAKIDKTSENLMKEIQDSRDYTNKRIGELKGDLVKEIRNVDTKTQKIINILNRNSLVNEAEKEGLVALAV